MNIDHFFFRLYAISGARAEKFLGSALPVTGDGGLLTCRHIVDGIPRKELAVHHNITGWKIHVKQVLTPEDESLDLAYLPQSLQKGPCSFFPILPPEVPLTGQPVYSYGFFETTESGSPVEQGYFSGSVVNMLKIGGTDTRWALTLPYALIEGMSGSAVLTNVNGPKLVGIGYGNQQSRVLAAQVLEYEDNETKVREQIHRIVEFGRAYHSDTIIRFLREVGATGYRVTKDPVPMFGLIPPPGLMDPNGAV